MLNGEKTSTFRLNEGFVHKGFLVYKDCPKEQWAEVVYVTHVYYVPLRQALEIDGFDEHTPDMETALKQMRVHYPDITLDTPILFAQHLGVPETNKLYPNEVKEILDANKNAYKSVGMGSGIETVLNAKIDGVHQPLAQLADVESEYIDAINVAMGARAASIVVDDQDVAYRAIQILRAQGRDRASFIPMSIIKKAPTT